MSPGLQPPQAPALSSLIHNNYPSTSTFSPRREFIRDQHQLSSFCLLALSGTASVRLYSFPAAVVQALRGYLHNARILANFREDQANNLCEFTVEGRPWALAKNVKTEKLIVDIITLVLRHGFTFLSTIDYGREQDDRIALAFSRPINSSRSDSPLSAGAAAAPHPPSGIPGGSTGGSPPVPIPRPFRVPFAISFSSSTVLRVINPPLHSTPAILQAVRGAWPRGVVAEKKIADTCFEFKLKGYKWFQEDTFAQDSLQHILSLLTALDAHAFTLLASLTLTNRSRIKDLWILTGPSHETSHLPDSPPQSPAGSSIELHRQQAAEVSGGVRHMRSATAPSPSAGIPAIAIQPHSRGGTDGAGTPNENRTHQPLSPLAQSYSNASAQSSRSLLRKPAPKSLASAPRPSVATGPPILPPSEPVRTTLPSEVGSVDMTGVGTSHQYRDDPRDVIYETGSGDEWGPSPDPDGSDHYEREPHGGYDDEEDDYRKPQQRSRHLSVPSTDQYHLSSGRRTPSDQNPSLKPPSSGGGRTPAPSQLLGGAFRDTAYTAGTGWRSTNTGWHSNEIPIAWGGSSAGAHDSGVGIPSDSVSEGTTPRLTGPGVGTVFPGGFDSYMSYGPDYPSGWGKSAAIPSSNIPSDVTGVTPQTFTPGQPLSGYFASAPGQSSAWPESPTPSKQTSPERHAVGAMVASPAVVTGPSFARKSEAGVVGVIPLSGGQHRPRRSYDSPRDHGSELRSPPARSESGDGWVFVDVADKSAPLSPGRTRSTSDPTRGSTGPEFTLAAQSYGYGYAHPPRGKAPAQIATTPPSSMPPSSMPRGRAGSQRSSSSIKRLFSLTRRDGHDPPRPSTATGGRNGRPVVGAIVEERDPYANGHWYRKAPTGPLPTHQRRPDQGRMGVE